MSRLALRRLSPEFALTLLMIVWQGLILANRTHLPTNYRLEASTGLNRPIALRFFYFYHHFGVFPVTLRGVPESLPMGFPPAEVLAKWGSGLRNDTIDPVAWGRLGDYARIYLFSPSVWIGAPVENASVLPFHILLFILSLIAVIWAFAREGRLSQGAWLVVLIGSCSFQLYEVYGHENVFSLPISVALITLALNLRFLVDRPSPLRSDFLIAFVSGIFLASVYQLRTEPAMIALSLAPAYLFARGFTWARRALLVTLFAATFTLGSLGWKAHFTSMRADAIAFVKDHGGIPFTGSTETHHPIWHNVFIGLGDFGGDKGYEWEDNVAYAYALPELRRTISPELEQIASHFRLSSQPNAPYYFKPELMPEYSQIIRKKILSDISSDPLWFARIIFKRVKEIFLVSLPLQLNLIWITLTLPLGLWAVLPLAAGLAYRRRWFELKIILFFAPMSLTALVIFSGRGTTLYQIAHLAALALVLGTLQLPRLNRKSV